MQTIEVAEKPEYRLVRYTVFSPWPFRASQVETTVRTYLDTYEDAFDERGLLYLDGSTDGPTGTWQDNIIAEFKTPTGETFEAVTSIDALVKHGYIV